MEYTRNFGSQFPDNILELRTFLDVDASILQLVNQIKQYQLEGDFFRSQALIDANKEKLDKYMCTSEYINLLDEETRNLEIYAKGVSQTVFYQSESPVGICSKNDVWIGD